MRLLPPRAAPAAALLTLLLLAPAVAAASGAVRALPPAASAPDALADRPLPPGFTKRETPAALPFEAPPAEAPPAPPADELAVPPVEAPAVPPVGAPAAAAPAVLPAAPAEPAPEDETPPAPEPALASQPPTRAPALPAPGPETRADAQTQGPPVGAPLALPLSDAEARPVAVASAAVPLARVGAEAPGRSGWWLPVLGVGSVLAGAALLRAGSRARPSPASPAAREEGPHAFLRAGQRAIAAGDHEGALRAFDGALALAPRLAVAHFCAGLCLEAIGRAEEAADAMRAAVEHAPDEGLYRVRLARACLALGDAGAAMDALAPVVRAFPESLDALRGDDALRTLLDHPRFLAMCGLL